MADMVVAPASDALAALSERDAISLLEAVRLRGGSKFYDASFKQRVLRTIASIGVRAYLDLVFATSRSEFDDPCFASARMHNGEGMIGCCWHNRVLGMLMGYKRFFGRAFRSSRCVAVISESKDGELVARMFRDLGGNCIRGSSSRRGREAMRHILHELDRGACVFVTPDGPRGPRYELQDGVIEAARLSGKPVVPISTSFGREARLMRSWDQFNVPLPFGRFCFSLGRPMFLPRRMTDEELVQARSELMDRMMELTRRVEGRPARTYRLGQAR